MPSLLGLITTSRRKRSVSKPAALGGHHFFLFYSGVISLYFLSFLLGGAVYSDASQFSVAPAELQINRAGPVLTVSGRLIVSNYGVETIYGVVAETGDQVISIGDIAPRSEIVSPSFFMVLEIGDSPYRHFLLPMTVRYYEGQNIVSISRGIPCWVPDEIPAVSDTDLQQ